MILWTCDAARVQGPADARAAALLAMAGARQASSPTAQAQARLPAARRLAGAAFAGPVAVSIARWHG